MKKDSKILGSFYDFISKRSILWSFIDGMYIIRVMVGDKISDMLFVRDYESSRESFYSQIYHETF